MLIGMQDKVSAEEEKDFLDELMVALKDKWPSIVIQFEDWKNRESRQHKQYSG